MSLILQIDADVAIVNKPPLMPSQPDRSGDADLLTAVRRECGNRVKSADVYPVHRLDRPVGGLCAVALNKKAAAELSDAVAFHTSFEKIYLCVTEGVPPRGEMADLLVRDKRQEKARIALPGDKDAKPALLFCEPLAVSGTGKDALCLCAVRLGTGRFHQIRAQLSSRGCPIYGDTKYGSRKKTKGIALFSAKLSFTLGQKTYSAEALPDVGTAPWSLFSAEDYEKLRLCRFES